MIDSVTSAAEALRGGAVSADEVLHLRLGACRLAVRSNDPELLAELGEYFAHVRVASGPSDRVVEAIERDAPELGVPFVDWAREPGKRGRKDSTFDVPGGRLVRKVRTGMVFLHSATVRLAAGPCRRFANQVINFINAQVMSWLQQRGWLLCHAAALARGGQALGIAGLSGGGKSTLALHLMERQDVAYVTNDRLLVRREAGRAAAVGIPKQPRVNPGTLVHNPRLRGLLPPGEVERLLALPPERLWTLEDKRDVLVPRVYGPGRTVEGAPLAAFLVLTWRRDRDEPLRLERVDLAGRPQLLGAIMKSPGPFHQYADGSFFRDDTPLRPDDYLAALAGVPIWEASGGVDFAALTRRCHEEVMP